ncbi:hypothetical protein PIB30_039509, partial [Stylosanthes scabra]|nr:hypothetical protein [Stylosanthes scabra]
TKEARKKITEDGRASLSDSGSQRLEKTRQLSVNGGLTRSKPGRVRVEQSTGSRATESVRVENRSGGRAGRRVWSKSRVIAAVGLNRGTKR